MKHVFAGLTNKSPEVRWLFKPAALGEAVAILSEAISDNWTVECKTDCYGNTSIVTLPALDDAGMPQFIVYEEGGHVRMGTIRDDEWESDHAFDSFRQAAEALIGKAKACSIGESSPSFDKGMHGRSTEVLSDGS